jgi:hypothetical protein
MVTSTKLIRRCHRFSVIAGRFSVWGPKKNSNVIIKMAARSSTGPGNGFEAITPSRIRADDALRHKAGNRKNSPTPMIPSTDEAKHFALKNIK